ncbi:hypothetical protein AGMMS49990_06970 [Endomicrobiia bacterium]|nr:hypothetical protein AGMMS49990_06970 [Endomicrobiia bacterium]
MLFFTTRCLKQNHHDKYKNLQESLVLIQTKYKTAKRVKDTRNQNHHIETPKNFDYTTKNFKKQQRPKSSHIFLLFVGAT